MLRMLIKVSFVKTFKCLPYVERSSAFNMCCRVANELKDLLNRELGTKLKKNAEPVLTEFKNQI